MKKVLNVALWVILYFVAYLASECLGFLHPFCFLYFGLFAAALCAWPYSRLVSKHPVPGMAIMSVAVVLIVYILVGEVKEFKLLSVWGSLALGLVAEIVRYLVTDKRKAIIYSYLPLSLIPFTSTEYMWSSPTHMYAETVEEMGTSYADTMQPLFNGWLEAGMVVVTLLVAFFCIKIFTNRWRN